MKIILERKDLNSFSQNFPVEEIGLFNFHSLSQDMINKSDNIDFVDTCGRTKNLKFKGI